MDPDVKELYILRNCVCYSENMVYEIGSSDITDLFTWHESPR